MCFQYVCKIGPSKLTSIFDSILVPTGLHFPSKIKQHMHQKWNLEGIDFFNRFCIDCFIDVPSIWDVNLELCWPLRRTQDASKTIKNQFQNASWWGCRAVQWGAVGGAEGCRGVQWGAVVDFSSILGANMFPDTFPNTIFLLFLFDLGGQHVSRHDVW